MARLHSKGQFRGSIGNLVFRTLDEKDIAQSKAKHIRQTQATKISSLEFRQCSNWAKQLRLALTPFLVGKSDGYMYRRLNGAFYKALLSNTQLPKGQRTPLEADMSDLVGFEFNTHSPFTKYFLPSVTAIIESNHSITVTVPAFDPATEVVFPKEAEGAELVLYAMAMTLTSETLIKEAYTIFPFTKQDGNLAAMSWTSAPLPEGYFVVVCAKVLYYSANPLTVRNYLNSTTLNPATIVAAGRL